MWLITTKYLVYDWNTMIAYAAIENRFYYAESYVYLFGIKVRVSKQCLLSEIWSYLAPNKKCLVCQISMSGKTRQKKNKYRLWAIIFHFQFVTYILNSESGVGYIWYTKWIPYVLCPKSNSWPLPATVIKVSRPFSIFIKQCVTLIQLHKVWKISDPNHHDCRPF